MINKLTGSDYIYAQPEVFCYNMADVFVQTVVGLLLAHSEAHPLCFSNSSNTEPRSNFVS